MAAEIYEPLSTAMLKKGAVDFDTRKEKNPINLVQHDLTVPVLAIQLKKGGVTYKIPSSSDVNIRMDKRDGHHIYNPALGVNAERTVVYFAVTHQMSTGWGDYYPIVEIRETDGVAGSAPLWLHFDRNPVPENAIVSSDEYKTLEQLIAEVSGATEDAKTAATAASQSANAAAGSERKSAEYASAADASAQNANTYAQNANSSAVSAEAAKTAAQQSATAASQSANAAASSAKAAAAATGAVVYGVEFSGSNTNTRTGAAKDFVFTPGTDTVAGQNDFDGAWPWAGMRRCCCTLNADGTVTVNAYKGQPGYIEDGTNGEVLVEVPLFYVAGQLDVNPKVSSTQLPGFRAPAKFVNADGNVKQKCYLPAFPGSIGTDGKLHSIAGAVSTGNTTITAFLAAARKWGDTYSIGTSADFEVLAYLMIVVYGTRNVQAKVRGVANLYATNQAVTGARTSEAAVTVAKGVLEVGNVISIGTGNEDESIAKRRIVTAIEAIDGDAANVKAVFDGEPVTTTTDNKIWRIMQSTGTANSVISTCGSPVSNTDGKHSFVFYGVENPLYGNQWRFECDWKLIDGVPYYCDDPTKYQWSSAADYIKLDTLTLPGEGWIKNLQADERVPWLQVPKEVGGSSSTYTGDYIWINKSGTRIALRGAYSFRGDLVGAFTVYLSYDASLSWWSGSADLSIPG